LPSSEHLLRGLVITIGLFTNGGIIVVMWVPFLWHCFPDLRPCIPEGTKLETF
jgi:hypothetical protein